MTNQEIAGAYNYICQRVGGSHEYAENEVVYWLVKQACEQDDPGACDRWRDRVQMLLNPPPRISPPKELHSCTCVACGIGMEVEGPEDSYMCGHCVGERMKGRGL